VNSTVYLSVSCVRGLPLHHRVAMKRANKAQYFKPGIRVRAHKAKGTLRHALVKALWPELNREI
jgi:hypothetical protein